MSASILRSALCWVLIAIFPLSMFATDSGAAMLYSKGTAWLNGSQVPRSSAIFPGDIVQTQSQSLANINASGSNVMILSDSLVKFEGSSISVEHGTVSVVTSKGMGTRAGEVTVTPASNSLTEFEVADLNGTVQVVARKGDVTINNGSETTTLPQGQQTTQDESTSKKKKRRAAGAAPAGVGGWLDSPVAIASGLAVIGGVTTWVLLQGDDPLSPSSPKR